MVLGSAELLADELPPAERTQTVATIAAQVERMSSIVRRLLELGQRSVGERAWTDVNALVLRAAALLEGIAFRRGCAVQVTPAPEALHARVNAQELEQVVTNLIANAIQASREGGTVRVVCTGAVVEGDPCVRVCVEDEGHGIPPDVLPHVFDPFFTTRDVGEGTGLGLSVSYGIVRDHHGTIRVASEVGRGARFEVELPVMG